MKEEEEGRQNKLKIRSRRNRDKGEALQDSFSTADKASRLGR